MPSWIYKIIKDNNIIYIGSTTRKYFSQRKGDHTKPTTAQRGKQSYLQNYVKDNGGWKTFNFEIIEEFDTIEKNDLLLKEKNYIEKLKPSHNLYSPITSIQERYKKHYQAHKKNINSDINKKKEFYIKQKERESYKKYNEKRCSIKINCECGGIYSLQNKTNHFKRNIHLNYEASL